MSFNGAHRCLFGTDAEVAFRRTVEAYKDKVFRFISLFVRDEQECEELTSDVFVALWKSMKRRKEIEHMDSYLFILSKHVALNHLRRRTRVELYESLGQEIPLISGSKKGIVVPVGKRRYLKMGDASKERIVQCFRNGEAT